MARKTLGRGLQALLGLDEGEGQAVALAAEEPTGPEAGNGADTEAGNETEPGDGAETGTKVEPGAGDFSGIAIDDVDRNPYQPRSDFDPTELTAMAESIRGHGVIQPIVVRRAGDRYELIAGERRLRAAREAGLVHIPARVLEADDRQMFELALVENLQRSDLNPMEKAHAFHAYVGRFGTTHEALAAHLGVDRSTVTNLIRLVELPDAVQGAVREGKITGGHARALLAAGDAAAQIALCRKITEESLSVRQTEALVRADRETGGSGPATKSVPDKQDSKSNHVRSLETDLCRKLGTKVEIRPKAKDRGTIVIHFQSNDDFERILEAIQGR